MHVPRSRPAPRFERWLTLLPLALLVVSACSQAAPEAYNGVQARTPIDKIPAGGQMKNFQLIANNPLLDPKLNVPRGANGGITTIRDCLYVGSNNAAQPTIVVDMKDPTKPTVVGDVLHSRVARSDINTLVPLGARVTLSGPPTLIPTAWRCGLLPPGVSYDSDLDRALDGADAVIALRLQRERQEAGLLPSLREYSRVWGLTSERVARMRPGAPVMHPGPMNEGIEIDAAVAHGTQSLIETQVTNGVAVRMALLYLLAAGVPLEDRA